MLMSVSEVTEPSRIGDLIASHLNLKLEDKQSILSISDTKKRLEKLVKLMQSEIEILQVDKRIRSRVKKQMERSQKEYYLNEQMQAIQKELGEKDESKIEFKEIEKSINEKLLSKEAKEKVKKELRKLKMMSPMSAEATVVRNYIDWVLGLPWNEYTDDRIDLDLAKEVLEKDHFGLSEVKERILEYISVRILTKNTKGQVICFVGPPGVGKTSLARSIAKSLNKEFVKCSLGGVRDEAEIHGHRRTYVGAMPGKIIQLIKKAGSSNPVILLDEVDKMSMDMRGDPSSALLEVLDPEQNSYFGDHYIEVDYDLSKVMFILTANNVYNIPRPLLDRMEIIHISGYTENEKFSIAKKYLIKKQMLKHGLNKNIFDIKDDAVKSLIRHFTREAGVRNLEKQIATISRKTAKLVVENSSKTKNKKSSKSTKIKIKSNDLEDILKTNKLNTGKIEKVNKVGLANGLAYTDSGGELLQIEVTVVPGKGHIKITGKLGEVMQESAQTAMTYVRSRANLLGLKEDFYSKIDIHLHVPEGAVPKDGPSAGITMATCITSALTKISVKRNVAMTGEITLRGRVLPIGGLKEKLLAAKASNTKVVLIPKENVFDIKNIPKDVTKGLNIIPVDHVDQALRIALDLKNPESFLITKRKSKSDLIPLPVVEHEKSRRSINLNLGH